LIGQGLTCRRGVGYVLAIDPLGEWYLSRRRASGDRRPRARGGPGLGNFLCLVDVEAEWNICDGRNAESAGQ
jgi:hypothetical protein